MDLDSPAPAVLVTPSTTKKDSSPPSPVSDEQSKKRKSDAKLDAAMKDAMAKVGSGLSSKTKRTKTSKKEKKPKTGEKEKKDAKVYKSPETVEDSDEEA
ncbi:hypothetical protein HK097_006035, partial [Rhizophlyctis rosea]